MLATSSNLIAGRLSGHVARQHTASGLIGSNPSTAAQALKRDEIITLMHVDWNAAQRKAARTARWAVTMTKVRIRNVVSRTHWQLVTFCGKAGGESVGIVDLIAVRKDHGPPILGTKRGDMLQIILIQVKGGTAPMPTAEDAQRLRAVAKRLHARHILLAIWKKGRAAKFFSHRVREGESAWSEVDDLNALFR